MKTTVEQIHTSYNKRVSKLFILLLLIFSGLLTTTCYAQNNSIVLNGAYIVLDGGTATNNIYVVVDQPNPSGIVRLSAGGHINSENQYNYVKWLSGSTTGSYVFPFGVGGNPTDYIPFTFNKTAGGSSISMSTWTTDTQNMPHAASTNVGAVTEMTGSTDSVVRAVDRFWDIQALATTADLTFSYRGSENTTASPSSLLMAQHWNGNSWDAQVGAGTAGVNTGIGTAGPFIGQTTFSPWILTTYCDATITQEDPICVNAPSITLTAAETGGTWTGTGITDGVNGIFDPSIAGTGNHEITYTLACGDTDTMTIVVNSLPTLSTSFTAATCGNTDGTATVSATGGSGAYTYQWNDPANQTTATATALPAGSYQVVVTDNNGCADTASVNINSATGPIVTITNVSNNNCNGDSVGMATANVTGGQSPYTYAWDDGETTATAIHLAAGNHTVTVTDDNGCISSKDITISEPNAISITIDNTTDASCGNSDGTGTVSATGGTGTLHYQWNDPANQTTQTATGIAAGNYLVTVTDDNGCLATKNITITNTNGPAISLNNITNVSCNGKSDGSVTAQVSGGQSPYTYAWDNGVNAATDSTLSVGNHTVTVTDDNGCISSESITITEPGILAINASLTPTDCEFINGTIAVQVTGGTPNYAYVWSSGESTSTITDLSSGTYTVMITDANGCTLDSTFTIATTGHLAVDAQPDNATIEAGESIGITTTVAGNSTDYTYSWSPANGLSCINCPNPTAQPSETTTYIVTVKDTTGCSGADTVLITVKSPCPKVYVPTIFSPNADGKNDSFCIEGGCIQKFHLQIFDRWGETVFESTKIDNCWDGKFKGKMLNTGVFVFKLHVTTSAGGEIDKSGNLNLVR